VEGGGRVDGGWLVFTSGVFIEKMGEFGGCWCIFELSFQLFCVFFEFLQMNQNQPSALHPPPPLLKIKKE
jgi:hypothetical protein